ncbi:MAG: RNA polymerase sigma factor [Thermoanaerobaculales bacterium]|jgi:RNA polymerase sigma-70 factor (ECF subfamily)|nr:RNA polymerase sigma factor [Thermoanaerobaculales bacterium]
MTPPTRPDLGQDDRALVLMARNGDREAFGELVERHQRRVWMVCRQYVGADEAEAVAQDSLVKAYTSLDRFDGRAAFTTWLTRIAINTCLDLLRRRRREGLKVVAPDDDNGAEAVAVIADDEVDPETRSMQREAVARLKVLETGLPDRQREIFRLRFYAEMELDEIAGALQVHVGTVKTQLHRAVHRLRNELGDVR